MALIDFGGVKERVVTRKEFPLSKARKVLKGETIAVIGYGVQGPAQALNMKDNGINVIIGQSQAFKRDWDRAKKDGWVPGKTLFDIEEACERGTVIQMLVSDAAQKAIWPTVKKHLKPGDALYFSHGFSIVYKNQTQVIPPKDVDVIMVAPKGSGTSLRRNFLSGAGINSSFAVAQDATGRARERCIALEPALAGAMILEERAGLRPCRSAIRLGAERHSSGKLIVHNYGHGGAGVTLSWGCAREVVQLLRNLDRGRELIFDGPA